MRALLVLGLTLFHSARIFDLLPFYVKNEQTSLAFMVLVGFVSQWGMPLFFVIAGIAAWHSLKKRTPFEFVLDRVRRLVVPLIFGLLVLVPPQHYYAMRTSPDYHESYWQFYPSFFRVVLTPDFPEFVKADPSVGVFGPAHLWFLLYLFAFSMASLPLFLYLRSSAGLRFVSRLAGLCQKPAAIFLLAVPVIVIETFVITEETTGWNRFAYIPFLLCGYLFAADHRFEESLYRHRYAGLVAGTLAVLAFFAVSVTAHQAGDDPTRGFALNSVFWRLLKGCSAFLWIVVILGLARKYKHGSFRSLGGEKPESVGGNGQASLDLHGKRSETEIGRARLYINDAVMPFYIIHQTVIVVIGFYVVKWQTGVMLKYAAIVTVTLAITLLLFDLVIRRTNLTRFLFGMKPLRK